MASNRWSLSKDRIVQASGVNSGVTLIAKFSATEILHVLSSVADEHHRIAIDDNLRQLFE